MASVLRTDSLTKVYGKNTVVDHVSMNIERHGDRHQSEDQNVCGYGRELHTSLRGVS